MPARPSDTANAVTYLSTLARHESHLKALPHNMTPKVAELVLRTKCARRSLRKKCDCVRRYPRNLIRRRVQDPRRRHRRTPRGDSNRHQAPNATHPVHAESAPRSAFPLADMSACTDTCAASRPSQAGAIRGGRGAEASAPPRQQPHSTSARNPGATPARKGHDLGIRRPLLAQSGNRAMPAPTLGSEAYIQRPGRRDPARSSTTQAQSHKHTYC